MFKYSYVKIDNGWGTSDGKFFCINDYQEIIDKKDPRAGDMPGLFLLLKKEPVMLKKWFWFLKRKNKFFTDN